VYDKKLKNPWHWEKLPGHERNEALDCCNYANAAFKALDPDLDAIEKRIKAAALRKDEQAAVITKKKAVKKKPHTDISDVFNDW
ncbi:MAG: phage terminase large subunit family protein, partial [[Eubacterium] siraeum]|nr:phage terminase large subunit family protein [[Eubacterium] siraeum]